VRVDIAVTLSPLTVLFDEAPGDDIPLPPPLRNIYGRLSMPPSGMRPYLFANFVQSLDGVVTLDAGTSAGRSISGANQHDRFVMGLLRSLADAVIVGAGTLRSVPNHRWTPAHIYPDLATEFAALRRALGKQPAPLNVIVTASGDLGEAGILRQDEVPVLVVTTAQGAGPLVPTTSAVQVVVASQGDEITPEEVLSAVASAIPGRLFLFEAGPTLMGRFLAERLIDELFLTVAPQIAGRDDAGARPGLAAGRTFAPDHPVWARLVSVRRADGHLFLRYVLPSRVPATA